ncbi:MAG: hypothetical protein JXR37_31905 [Kiritimatiellae bacterium]|nr:hypothetical protein [Kiritimatiellia bacterium]
MRIPAITLLAASVLVAARFAAQAAVYDVKTHGAVADGEADDTGPIRNAINAANNADGANIVFFPAGTYLVRDIPLTTENRGAPGLDKNPEALTLRGAGAMRSVLKRKPARRDLRIGTIARARNLVVEELGFDANGIDRFGGFNFYGGQNITVRKCRFIDSDPTPINGYDRFGFLFGGCRDVEIADNYMDEMQMEVDYCQRVKIIGNIVERPRETGGIGIWAVNHNQRAEDYLIKGNWVIDPSGVNGGAILAQLDAPRYTNCLFRKIHILDNVVVYGGKYDRAPVAVKLGTPDNSKPVPGTVFDDVRVEGNRIYAGPGPAVKPPKLFVFGNSSKTSGFLFENLVIRNNTRCYDGDSPFVKVSMPGAGFVNASNRTEPYSEPELPAHPYRVAAAQAPASEKGPSAPGPPAD